MQTLDLPSGDVALHHGDFSGEVIIRRVERLEVRIPMIDLRAVVAAQIRTERISALEQMSDDDILQTLLE